MEVLASGYLSRYGDLNDPKFTHKVYTFEENSPGIVASVTPWPPVLAPVRS